MITINILRAEEGKIYTNGKIKGQVVWVPAQEADQWYQIDADAPIEENSYIDKFKEKFDSEVEE